MSEEATVTYVYHPHELTLKGKNRPQFENRLTENLRQQMKNEGVTVNKIEKITGRHFLIAPECDEEKIKAVSPRVFGIANYARCYTCERDFEVLKNSVQEHFTQLLSKRKIESFKVECSRVDKRFPMQSPQVCKDIGAVIHDNLNVPVNLDHPDITLHIEVLNDKFVYFSERFPGALGLPIRSSGNVACLLSGGFDSPVTVWMMMRRGCNVTLVHFHSAPFGEWRSSVTKIRRIVKQLHLYGGPNKFYAIPIGELQRQIANQAPEKLRVTLYRRLMMRVAKEIAQKHNCTALATGDSLGQVASQTIDSMTSIQCVVQPMIIMRPLLAFCKEEIMDRARLIGTHDISAMSGGDCCSHMLPKKVATNPSMEVAEEGEKKLDIPEMVRQALEGAQLMDVNDPWNEDEKDEDAVCPFTLGPSSK
ncbi:thiamine biosynthesis protein ThiI [Tritrichomonas foetus]|uniref:Thiamine biosynthesis protein ThiI n=1 Tax=Tritrichomonas foetus TaxID=1144522 RepID=A0A1J4KU52_9EUKA|nr:thiamine biosynthesis protein ThiI [Tritrichomonas foetus]|eukprot:OHT13190.1 thiamine biosynthesis protein ThiI [Tritrichomonas foetus]